MASSDANPSYDVARREPEIQLRDDIVQLIKDQDEKIKAIRDKFQHRRQNLELEEGQSLTNLYHEYHENVKRIVQRYRCATERARLDPEPLHEGVDEAEAVTSSAARPVSIHHMILIKPSVFPLGFVS